MKRFLIVSGVAVAVLILLGFAAKFLVKKHDKSFSPEEEVSFTGQDLKIHVYYNRPYKKGREIFGALVPYQKVWRTGANEATTFQTNKDLLIEGKTLKKVNIRFGLSLTKKPGKSSLILNMANGGIGADGEANRNPSRDIVSVDVHAVQQAREFEQFTISFEEVGADAEMVLIWDKTLVAVPFSF